MFPGSIVTTIFLLYLSQKYMDEKKLGNFRYQYMQIIPIFLILATLLVSMFGSFYREHNIMDLHIRVKSGPYQGLYTIPGRQPVLRLLKYIYFHYNL